MTKRISIASDYTKYPHFRHESWGEGSSGQRFRDELLIPALQEHGKVVVDLDGTRGYGSSFLEEAFGGAVRKNVPLTRENLVLESENEFRVQEIWGYIDNAANGAKNGSGE